MSTMREDLAAALESNADEDDSTQYEETQQEIIVDEAEEPAETQASQETGSEGTTEPAPSDTPNASDGAPNDGTSASELEASKPNSGDSIKAPVDWGPKEREDWSKIPRHLQEKVMAREKEISGVMEQTSTARKTHDQFSQMVQRYGPSMQRVAGDTPMEAVNTLFDVASQLNTGSAVQKAGVIAQLISQFDIDINTLDSALVGAAPTESQAQEHEFQRRLDERMAPFERQMGQQQAYEQQQHQQRQQSANNEVQQFAQGAEFLADVRMDMADLIDMSAKQGREITMQQAYDKACTLNPQIQAVISQRSQQQQLTQSSSTMAGKRAAASSITGSRGGGGSGGSAGSMRDTIAAAWDGQGKL